MCAMTKENDLIPYATSPLPEGPWLVFAPHPDDETFGMGGSLFLAFQKDITTSVVVLTDGSRGGTEPFDNRDLINRRIEEAQKAAQCLGVHTISFWKEKDRQLYVTPSLIAQVAEHIQTLCPATVFFPSPMEPHPDHRATAALVWAGVQHCPEFTGNLYSYEITVQGPINCLIDISEAMSRKDSAIEHYTSQLAENNYKELVQALDTTRTLTLPSSVQAAEGFWRYDLHLSSSLVSHTLQAISPYLQGQEEQDKALVSIIVRTKDRKVLLHNALQSIAFQTYRPLEVIVVNDGGCPLTPADWQDLAIDLDIRYIALATTTGRAHAGNVGIQEAQGSYIGFLDDDDAFLPDHIETLVQGIRDQNQRIAYCKVNHIERSLNKSQAQEHLLCTFGQPYDRQELLLNNYIPFIALLFEAKFLKFLMLDESFELYEDWDLLIRAGELTDFLFIDQVTSLYYQGQPTQIAFRSDQATIRNATLKLYRKHWTKISPGTLFELRETNRMLSKAHYDLKTEHEKEKQALFDCQANLQALTQSKSWRMICLYRRFRTWLTHIVKRRK